MNRSNLYFTILFVCIIFCMSSCSHTPSSDDNPVPSLKITGNYDGCGIGVVPFNDLPSSASIDSYELLISREVSIVSFYRDFTYPFPLSACDTVIDHGSIPMLTWEPWKWSNHADTTFSMDNIIAGNCDAYILSYARSIEAWGKPIFLRFAHEMDGYWYPWGGSQNGSNEAAVNKYRTAWRRIHATFEAAGATNVTWIWCTNQYYLPHDSWNTPEGYYPGDDCVDWVGADGYSSAWSTWCNFTVLFGNTYNTLIQYNKPVMICEMARSTEITTETVTQPPTKQAWITDTFNAIRTYSKIKAFVYFNIDKTSDGEWDWRIQSTPESVAAMRAAMTDEAFYLSKIN